MLRVYYIIAARPHSTLGGDKFPRAHIMKLKQTTHDALYSGVVREIERRQDIIYDRTYTTNWRVHDESKQKLLGPRAIVRNDLTERDTESLTIPLGTQTEASLRVVHSVRLPENTNKNETLTF